MNTQLKIKDLAVMGVMTAIALVSQVGLSFLPNIELVTLLFILYTLIIGKKVLGVVYAFVFLEGVMYGFGLWWINYLYVWTVLCLITLALRKQTSFIFWSIISGLFGISFGALCSIPYFFISGPSGAFAYWIAGIPSDITHCIGNVILCLLLFKPLHYILTRIDYCRG